MDLLSWRSPAGVAVCALRVLTLAGCGSGSSTESDASAGPSQTLPGEILVNGELILSGPNSLSQTGTAGDACVGTGGFSDITNGAQVIVTDAGGKTLALSTLGVGIVGSEGAGTPQRTCRFNFTVGDVPEGQKFYGIKVAGRDGPQFPEGEISLSTVTLTLGS